MRHRTGWTSWLLVTVVAVSGQHVIRAEDSDPDDPDAQAAQLQAAQFEVAEDNFDQWIFGGARTASAGRQRLETQLKLRMEAVDRACRLNEVQKKKLLLAGRGDIKRFWEQYELVRQKFLLVRKDQQKFNEIWQDIQPLQMTLNAGLFNDQSFLLKTIRKTLNDEQAAKYDEAESDRIQTRYHAKLELMVALLESQMPLRHEQREKFLQLLRDETKPTRRAGQYEYYVMLLQASKIPEAKLKPLFDAAQWKIVQAQLAQGRGMEQFLKQNGFLPEPSTE